MLLHWPPIEVGARVAVGSENKNKRLSTRTLAGGSNSTIRKIETCWSGRLGWICIELRDSEISGKVQRSGGSNPTVKKVETC